MEFFLLALIERGGLNSFYALQRKAGLQPGGIRPSLDRLEREGFLSRGEQASRRRREFALTDSGRQLLKEKWHFSLQSYLDLESILRAVAVALLMGNINDARAYLRDASGDLRRSAKQRELDSESFAGKSDPISVYMWMRSVCESRRRTAEADTLDQMKEELGHARPVAI